MKCEKCNGTGYMNQEEFIDCPKCDGFGYMQAEPEEMGFVNVYKVTRHYGGAEEGGWYFNWFECLESFPCRYKNRQEIMEYLEGEHAHQKWGNIYSVLDGADLDARWEKSPKESQSTERPYYE
jgi:hypothetical protein